MKTKSKRLANIELLRIIAMCMVVMLHYLGKGNLLPDMNLSMGINGYVAWILETLSIVSVNVYVLISGYFLVDSEFRVGKLIKLILQVLFYTILMTIVACATGLLDVSELGIYHIIRQVFPIQMEHYWFVTAYIIMYILSPVLAAGIKSISQKQLQVIIILFGIFMCVEKSILPFTLTNDKKGYDALWFICLFLIAAYIRLYGIKIGKRKKIMAALYFGACFMVFAEEMAIATVYGKTGKLQYLLNISYQYNHIFVLLAAVGLFMFFLNCNIADGKLAKLICKISPYTLGVYLLHEHIYVRYLWPRWLGCEKIQGPISLVVSAISAVIIIFAVGVLVDWLRSLLFNVGSRIIYGKKA